jgi:hypothetical protein
MHVRRIAQLGNLHFQSGDLDSAAREYGRANHAFPGHPPAWHALRLRAGI